jgi:hypothetical protein
MSPIPRLPEMHGQGATRREALCVGSLSLLGLSFSEAPSAVAQNAGQKLYLEAYTDRSSYQPGDEVRIHVSTNASRYALEFARLGASREGVWSKDNLPGAEYPVPDDASAQGCNWPVALTLKVPPTWKSGYYAARVQLAGKDGQYQPGGARPLANSGTPQLFFVVRPAHPGRDSRILFQLSTNTYNAYTNYGGYSVYAYQGRDKVQGRRVSLQRPQVSQFSNWEQPFIAWAEKAGYTLDFAVNNDLEFHPELLKSYKLVLSVGHDEYWSSPMRDHLEAFIAAGGNVAFFSGNVCCWQIRNEEDGRAFTCWKQSFGDDPYYKDRSRHGLLSTLWSHHLVGRSENQLTGVGFLWGGYHLSHGQFMDGPGAFTVERPDHWLFADTGLKRGDAFGGKDTIVGYECDGCQLERKDGLPVPTGRDGTPRDFTILATAPARWHPDDCEWYERWQKGRTGHAVLGMYTHGGTVVTAGTTDWAHGLRGRDRVVEQITRNVLDRLAKG